MKSRSVIFLYICMLSICSFFMPSTVVAQDFIKETSVKVNSSSIIRTITPKKWLVYSCYDNMSSFTMVDETSATISVLYLPILQDGYIVVNDFEIMNDSAFFCGYKKHSDR